MIPIAIRADFECGNAESTERLGPPSFLVTTKADEAINNDYYKLADYYCAVRLENP